MLMTSIHGDFQFWSWPWCCSFSYFSKGPLWKGCWQLLFYIKMCSLSLMSSLSSFHWPWQCISTVSRSNVYSHYRPWTSRDLGLVLHLRPHLWIFLFDRYVDKFLRNVNLKSVSGQFFLYICTFKFMKRQENGTLTIWTWYFLIKCTLHTSNITRISLLRKYLQYKWKTWNWKPTFLVSINLHKWYFVAFCNLKLTIKADFS